MAERVLVDIVVAASVSATVFAIAATVTQLVQARRDVDLARHEKEVLEEDRRWDIERSRIAREMHDVVAHSMSIVHMRATSARYRLHGMSDEVADEFDGIALQARTALGEMRGLLGVLREGAETLDAPQPTLSDLPALVAATRDAGIEVRTVLGGSARAVSGDAGIPEQRHPARGRIVGRHRPAGPRRRARPDRAEYPAVDAAWLRRPRWARHPRHDRTHGIGRRFTRARAGSRRRLHRDGPGAPTSGGGRMSIRVLVVDDQPMFRAGLVAILGAQPDIEIAGEAEDGEQALARTRSLKPDVVLMDVRMPKRNGIEATEAILGDPLSTHRPRIVMLTTFDVDDYVFAALRAGASGFLLKDAAPDELVNAVRVVHGGDALLSPRVTNRLVRAFTDTPKPRASDTAALAALTERELEVFRLLAAGRSNAEIAATLFIAEQTTKSHVSRILTKLGLRDRVHAVVPAYESGVVVPGAGDDPRHR
ncbi:DNA-binding NarL/FixJ family response regulator [Pseudoclavibacter chungangensis]|nr:DNA-binding NarL/FixJ family response regulator [Pseudoclavibacter chungangensis]